jgi:hypothetical protein
MPCPNMPAVTLPTNTAKCATSRAPVAIRALMPTSVISNSGITDTTLTETSHNPVIKARTWRKSARCRPRMSSRSGRRVRRAERHRSDSGIRAR